MQGIIPAPVALQRDGPLIRSTEPMPDPKSREDVLREGWLKASRATVGTGAVLFLLSRGQKTEAGELLKALGPDWSALNPYAIGLFGVPVMVVLCFWTLWWARAFAKAQSSSRAWHARVATKTNLAASGPDGQIIACWSLVVYVAMPIAILATLLGKFLNGRFYFSDAHGHSCLVENGVQPCTREGSGGLHFAPPHGLRSLWDTPYRYEGNLTYVPPWQGLVMVGLSLAVVMYLASYVRLLLRRTNDHGGAE